MSNTSDAQRFSRFLFLTFIAFGFFLRVYLLPEQILLDDEWHPLNFVINRSLYEVLTSHSFGANSLFQNLHTFLLFHSIGWSEFLLRLPSLVFGIAVVIVFPLITRHIIGEKAALILSGFLAISPCLIYYSRFARPYSVTVFCAFIALTSFYYWINSGKKTYRILYIVSACLAVYAHTYSILPVLTPIFCLGLTYICKMDIKSIIPKKEVLVTAGILGIFILFCIAPAYIYNPWWKSVVTKDNVTISAIWDFLKIIAGTNNTLLILSFLLLAVWGANILYKKHPFFSFLAGCTIIFYLLSIYIMQVYGSASGIILARYGIVTFPLLFMYTAVALSTLLKRFITNPFLEILVIGLIFATFVYGGPLKQIYSTPNNFTNHSAYQHTYKSIDWDESVTRNLSEDTKKYKTIKTHMPEFYEAIAKNHQIKRIIEYPMPVGDHFNIFYYYQHFHAKDVVIGYVPSLILTKPVIKDFIYGNMSADYIFSRIEKPDQKKIKMRTMVDITNMQAIKRSGAQLLILHKNLFKEAFPGQFNKEKNIDATVKALSKYYDTALNGRQTFEDENLTIWDIHNISEVYDKSSR